MVEIATKTCRICLQQIMENVPYRFLNDKSDLMLQSKLLDFLPELDLNITQNPISCSQCTRMINEIHQFKQLCVRTEKIIKNLSLQELPLEDILHIFKKEQVDETIKEEFVEDAIKTETVEDQCVQINMDIPVCIEESTSTKASYYCYNCNYYTDKKRNLIGHVSTHRNEVSEKKPFHCDLCSYSTIHNFRITAHKKMHLDIKPRVGVDDCGYGNSTETNKGNLMIHMNNQLVKKHKCSKCKYVTQSKTDIAAHIRFHSKKKTFCCTICYYRSPNVSNLKRHLRTHTGEKPYACNICNYRANETSQLKKHLHNHTGKKPFCCNICDYSSNEKSDLRKHLRIHTGEKPFCCYICDYRANQMGNLRSHLLKHTRENSSITT